MSCLIEVVSRKCFEYPAVGNQPPVNSYDSRILRIQGEGGY
jgi:hypothetical protein